jgi:putative transposase
MPRIARIVIPGWPHHITQRGNNRQDVFFTDDDRRAYLRLLKDRCLAAGVEVMAYCLMTNHVHLVAVPEREHSLAQAIGRTNFLYTQYINRRHRRVGHLWQNRFYSCTLDNVHLWRAVCYVERNPVRARIVRLAWRYPWSSAAAHTGRRDTTGLLDLDAWRRTWKPVAWQEQLGAPEDEDQVRGLRRSTHTGRPLAAEGVLSRLEHRLHRRLRPLPVGRPPKKQIAEQQ